MRMVELLTIDSQEIEFTELYHLDGSKLEVSNETHSILVWYDEHNSYEDWLLIKSNKAFYMDYIANKISLLDVIKANEIFFAKRAYGSYKEIKIIEKISNIDKYEYMPTQKSFLNFDFASESNAVDIFSLESLSLLNSLPVANYSGTTKRVRAKISQSKEIFENINELEFTYKFICAEAVNDTSYRRAEHVAKQ